MLQNFYGIIEVKHYQLGRLRLQTDTLKKDPTLWEEFQNNIKRISGIEKAVVNPINFIFGCVKTFTFGRRNIQNKIFKNRSSIKEVI